jgi:hypothetical protein
MNDMSTQAGKLRHGLHCLWPSEIAKQWYCEYKVHLKRLHPEVREESPALEIGEESHLVLANQAEPITAEEIEKSIREGKKLAICEWTLEGCLHAVRIRGRPDFFAFRGKKALLILDFKFSRAVKPFDDSKVQAEIYALLAESMGFTAEHLFLGIVIFPPSGFGGNHGDKEAMLQFLNEHGTLHRIYKRCEKARKVLMTDGAETKTIESEDWRAFLFRYDRNKAEKHLKWALEYWFSEREPIPEKRYPRKCFACALNAAGLCEHALQEPDSNFKIQRQPDGQIYVYRQWQ